MSAVVHGPALERAGTHHALLLLVALVVAVAVAVVVAVAVALAVQASTREPATRGGTPLEEVDLTCDYRPMTGTFC